MNAALAPGSNGAGPLLQARIRLGHIRCRWFDWLHRVDTCGQISVSQLGISDHRAFDVYGFSSSSISIVRGLLARLPIRNDEWEFVDVGSGKGRTLLLAREYPFKRVVGVEHSPDLVEISRSNLQKYAGRIKCREATVMACDALEYVPPEDENVIFYMFNPFSELLVIRCIESLAAVPLVPGKRRVLCFVQQRTHLATPVDLCRSSKAVRPLALRPMRFDWFSHPQLEASLFDVRASL